ncbi:Hypothetical predicted protein [Paramuricea clavata]|uniref:Uncharacterized protein n=1 Tax=Paramuricea clavata TaxID=317549 RepID=A0A6S7K1W8_PARCT|nr:Hypothetical predicted protein [Paramuricea clavata]
MAYTPIECYLGDLPDTSGSCCAKEYGLPGDVAVTAKEILVYLWVTTKGDEQFHRYYYQIETSDGKHSYPQFMNVAATEDIVLNSSNLWLPVFKDQRKVKVTLTDAEKSDKSKKGKCIAHKRRIKQRRNDGTEEDIDAHSQIFVIGYR